MAMSHAIRQQRFRQARLTGEKRETLLSAWLPSPTVDRLKALARINGRTIKGQLDILIREGK